MSSIGGVGPKGTPSLPRGKGTTGKSGPHKVSKESAEKGNPSEDKSSKVGKSMFIRGLTPEEVTKEPYVEKAKKEKPEFHTTLPKGAAGEHEPIIKMKPLAPKSTSPTQPKEVAGKPLSGKKGGLVEKEPHSLVSSKEVLEKPIDERIEAIEEREIASSGARTPPSIEELESIESGISSREPTRTSSPTSMEKTSPRSKSTSPLSPKESSTAASRQESESVSSLSTPPHSPKESAPPSSIGSTPPFSPKESSTEASRQEPESVPSLATPPHSPKESAPPLSPKEPSKVTPGQEIKGDIPEIRVQAPRLQTLLTGKDTSIKVDVTPKNGKPYTYYVDLDVIRKMCEERIKNECKKNGEVKLKDSKPLEQEPIPSDHQLTPEEKEKREQIEKEIGIREQFEVLLQMLTTPSRSVKKLLEETTPNEVGKMFEKLLQAKDLSGRKEPIIIEVEEEGKKTQYEFPAPSPLMSFDVAFQRGEKPEDRGEKPEDRGELSIQIPGKTVDKGGFARVVAREPIAGEEHVSSRPSLVVKEPLDEDKKQSLIKEGKMVEYLKERGDLPDTIRPIYDTETGEVVRIQQLRIDGGDLLSKGGLLRDEEVKESELDKFINKEPRTQLQLLKLTEQVAKQLEKISTKKTIKGKDFPGICHRDINPKNILVDSKGETATLIDYGSAKEIGEPLVDADGNFVHTRQFSPPEFFESNVADILVGPEQDVFSFGMTLWNILSQDSLDFKKIKDFYESAKQVTNEILISPKILQTAIADLKYGDTINFINNRAKMLIARCIDPDPKKRPTMTEVREELGKAIDEETKNPTI